MPFANDEDERIVIYCLKVQPSHVFTPEESPKHEVRFTPLELTKKLCVDTRGKLNANVR